MAINTEGASNMSAIVDSVPVSNWPVPGSAPLPLLDGRLLV